MYNNYLIINNNNTAVYFICLITVKRLRIVKSWVNRSSKCYVLVVIYPGFYLELSSVQKCNVFLWITRFSGDSVFTTSYEKSTVVAIYLKIIININNKHSSQHNIYFYRQKWGNHYIDITFFYLQMNSIL